MSINKDDKKNDQELRKINSKLLVLKINPTNIATEREKVFKDPDYNPIFTYKTKKTNFDKTRKELMKLDFSDNLIGNILREKKDELMIKCDLLESIGKEEFTSNSIKFWGKPTEKLIMLAENQMKKPSPEKKQYPKLKFDEVKKHVETYLKEKGLEWSVKEKKMVAIATVRPHEKKIFLKQNEEISIPFIKRLLNHECVHIYRYENGTKQPYQIFSYGFPDYLSTEEGLAIRYEEGNEYFEKRIRDSAGRVISADLTMRKSFSQLFNHFKEHYPEKKAFHIAARAKRGLKYTDKTGGSTKDIVYYKGYHEVKEFEKTNELTLLFYGKISVKYAKVISQIEGLKKPKMIPYPHGSISILL